MDWWGQDGGFWLTVSSATADHDSRAWQPEEGHCEGSPPTDDEPWPQSTGVFLYRAAARSDESWRML